MLLLQFDSFNATPAARSPAGFLKFDANILKVRERSESVSCKEELLTDSDLSRALSLRRCNIAIAQTCMVCNTADMQTSGGGLRERKRAETRDKLETAAVTLVLKNGIEHTTIDAICESADVSTRTFFNYFESKEDAILGLDETEVTSEVVEKIRAAHPDGDVVEITIRLMFGVLSPSINSSKLFKPRMKIVKAHPELLGRMANQMQRMAEQLTAAIRPILRESPGFREEDDEASQVSAELILSLCSSAARVTVRAWATDGNQTPIGAVEERAIKLVRTTVERMK